MSYADPARSISSEPAALPSWRSWPRVIGATAATIARTRIQGMGVLGYSLTWLTLPLVSVIMLAFIYRENDALLAYAIVAGAGTALLFGLIFNGGEILDAERQRGTLGNLFLAPLPRFVWLGGFQAFALMESIVNGAIAVGAGAWLFDVPLDIGWLALVVTIVLFSAALWGLSVILGAVGLLTRNANFLSNLIFPFMLVLSGTMFPVGQMPDWVRIPARMLPFSYGIEAMAAALTTNAPVADLASSLLPLLGFALALPVLGVVAFRRMERAVRQIGNLDIA